jgi:hypothetical protein
VLKSVTADLVFISEDLIYDLLKIHPDKCGILSTRSDSVRRLWHEKMFASSFDDFPLLATLIRNGLVPDPQIREMFVKVLEKGPMNTPNEMDNRTLIEKGFYGCLEEVAIANLSFFDWANRTKNLFIKHLSDNPITMALATKIYDVFNSTYYPWHMAESLTEFFRVNDSKRNEYIQMVNENPSVGFPNNIQTLRP